MENSRFKFRVWDKYTHETPAEEMQFLCFNGCLVDSDGCHHSPDGYIIEQCTGLSDKNGKLIYEGDIIHEVDKEADIDDVSQIVWSQYTCHFMKLDLPETGLDRHCLLCEDDSPYIEIIGNIHEQPEQKDVK